MSNSIVLVWMVYESNRRGGTW